LDLLLIYAKKPSKKPKEWKPLNKTATYKWLNRLGFYATEEKKGVYVDSHKRADVIEYQQNDFLLKLALLQALSTNYKEDANSVLQLIPPILSLGEKEHVIYYYNKSCFYAKEYFKRIWLDENQQKMPFKSKEGLIYYSDFISLKERLVIS
jgi:aryl-phospho-beta-D-glucosidase BglC (GH1 family)